MADEEQEGPLLYALSSSGSSDTVVEMWVVPTRVHVLQVWPSVWWYRGGD
jgi:hypothetical protein